MSNYHLYREKCYDQTDYPDLYKKVYWGGHRGKENKDILKNRNKFVKEYGITDISNARCCDKIRLFDLLYYEEDDNKNSSSINLTDTSINYKNSIYFDDKKHTEYYLYGPLPYIIKKCDNSVEFKSVKRFDTDHNEYYTSKKYPRCIIHIFSMVTNDIQHNFIIGSGYKEIYPLYAMDQRTYIMIRPRYKKDQNYIIEAY